MRSKNYQKAASLVDSSKVYKIENALSLALDMVKDSSILRTINVVFRLNLDPKYSEQNLRGAIPLPKGTGKTKKILVVTSKQQKEAQEAGADMVAGSEIVAKIQKDGVIDFDIIIATPEVMGELGKIGKILGPKKLMPNAKEGTVTTDVAKEIGNIRRGKVQYRVDKNGNIHTILGNSSFSVENLKENFETILNVLKKAKPHTVRGIYIKNININAAMKPGIKVLIEH